MAIIDELVTQIENPELRSRIASEVEKLVKQKKFGLVFEEHLPECTPLWDIPVRKGSKVALKTGQVSDFYTVLRIENGVATCLNKDKSGTAEFSVDDLISIAEFGEPIYPYLKPIDTVCNAPDSDLWHTLIEADNYHALQLLEYLYAGKVDCIYIDPPYNSGATDWKYNNNYVDEHDQYRHSKWLSFMQRRIKLAKKLLNPKDSVLIVTIDEKEYLHLGCLLEELFQDANIQMITSVINPSGSARKNMFSRAEEYIFFVFVGNSHVFPSSTDMIHPPKEDLQVRWASLLRSGSNSDRAARPNLFYPIFFSKTDGKFIGVGDSLELSQDKRTVLEPNNCFIVWPTKANGQDARWTLTQDTLLTKIQNGLVKFGKWKKGDTNRTISYLAEGMEKALQNGELEILGRDEDGTLITGRSFKPIIPLSVWNQPSHAAGDYGSSLLLGIFIKKRFTFPKSLYAVKETIRFITDGKPNALIVDFFAGSGTTLHAVNLLNAEDGGKRRCILVTNNEVSSDEAESLNSQGYKPGDPEWERLGIAHDVTWPRTVCSIEGHDVNGAPLSNSYLTSETRTIEKQRNIKQIKYIADISTLKQNDVKQFVSMVSKGILPQTLVSADTKYVVSDDTSHTAAVLIDDSAADSFLEALDGMDHITDFFIVTKNNKLFKQLKADITEMLGNIEVTEPVTMPMADGFKANAAFFKLSFLDKDAVALGRQFKEMLPTLWMKAGAQGPCPKLAMNAPLPGMLILPENRFAVLLDEKEYMAFADALTSHPEIDTIFIVTDSDSGYRDMIAGLSVKHSYQLYRDYLDNFRINASRR